MALAYGRTGWTPTRIRNRASEGRGAHARIRTGDLFLTKEMLYRLSYVGGLRFDSICSILTARFMSGIDQVLARARQRLRRVTPVQAAAEPALGAPHLHPQPSGQPARRG